MNRLLNHFKGDGLKAQLLKGATGTAGLKAINMVLTLAVGVLLARTLGPENYGIYAFVLSVITLLGLPTKAGLPTLIVRETAKYQLQEKWTNLRGLLTLANGFVVGFSILVAVVSAGVVWWLWGDEQGVKASTFLWALLLLPLIAFGNIRGATLRGLCKVVQGQLPEEVVRPLVLILLVGGVFALGLDITPQVAMQYTVLAALAAFAVGAILLFRSMPPAVQEAKATYETKVWAASLLPLSLITSIQIINTQVGTIVLGSFGLNEDAGLLKVATSAAALTATSLMMLNTVLAPHIVRLWRQQEYKKLEKMITVSTRLSFVVSIFVAVVLLVWGELLLGWLFGTEFVGAYIALIILLGGQIVNAMVGSVGLVLKQLHLEKKVLIASVTSVLLNIVMCLILGPKHGVLGVALAHMSSMIIWNAMNWYYALKYANLDCSILGFKRVQKVGS